jgi:hypothetical protein
LNETASAQLSIDFRTGRPTAVHAGNSCALQRAACIPLNRDRTRGILEAIKLTPSRQSLSADEWLATVARQSELREVPLISLENFGIHHDADGIRSSTFLTALPSGAEASPYFDKDWGAVYKFFDLRLNGSLGKKIELIGNPEGEYDVVLSDATLQDTLEKLTILNAAGAHPTEIVGLSDTGDYLIAKQPWAYPHKGYLADRDTAIVAIHGITPPITNLRRTVAVTWVDDRAWLVSDLHQRNIMRDQTGAPTIIDALIGTVPDSALPKLRWLREAVEDAKALRENRPLEKRKRFEDVDDDEL